MSDTDLPAGYRWANEFECEAYAADPAAHPEVIIVTRTVDATGRPYTEGESDVAVPNTLMDFEAALNYAIFAINTVMYPDASTDKDVEQLLEYGEAAVLSLADIRATMREMSKPRDPFDLLKPVTRSKP